MDDVYLVGCHRHHVSLTGQAKLKQVNAQTIMPLWEFDLSEMSCPKKSETDDCSKSWRVGRA